MLAGYGLNFESFNHYPYVVSMGWLRRVIMKPLECSWTYNSNEKTLDFQAQYLPPSTYATVMISQILD